MSELVAPEHRVLLDVLLPFALLGGVVTLLAIGAVVSAAVDAAIEVFARLKPGGAWAERVGVLIAMVDEHVRT